jgi:AcrR family transcriptional regulator
MQPNDTKKKLEMQALHFFALHDYERSSLNDIAEALGVTRGAIYHYFRNKDDLFHCSVLRLMDVLESWFVSSLPTEIPLKMVLDNLFNMKESLAEMAQATGLGAVVVDYTNTLYLMLTALKKFPGLKDRMEDIYSGFRAVLVEMMNRSIVAGEIHPDTDTRAVAFEITAFYEGALLLGAFSNTQDYTVLGPRVCEGIWKRIAIEGHSEKEETS